MLGLRAFSIPCMLYCAFLHRHVHAQQLAAPSSICCKFATVAWTALDWVLEPHRYAQHPEFFTLSRCVCCISSLQQGQHWMGVLKLSKDNAETSACLTASVDLLLHLPTPRSANLDLAQARCLRIPIRLQLFGGSWHILRYQKL